MSLYLTCFRKTGGCDLKCLCSEEKKGKVLVAQSCLTLCNPMDCMEPARLLCPWDFPGTNTRVPFPSQGDLPDPGIEPGSTTLQAASLSPAPPGKPEHSGKF